MRRRRSCGRSWGGWGMSDLEWPKYKLGELFEVQRESVTPGLTPDLEFFHHSLPAWDECGGPVVAKGAEIESNKTLVTNPCVLVSKLNPRKPRVSVIEHVGPERTHCASTEFICLRPLTAQSLPFWGYYFSASRFAQKLERYAIGSTNSHTRANPREPLKWTVSVPPLGEQEKIAQLLDTLDTQIRQTEALIAKLERIKQGLLTDLLTRGIGQNGQLRPTPDQAPHLYKDSPLGRIPREWEVKQLGEAADWFSGGTPSRAVASLWRGDFPLLTPKDMKQFWLADTSEHVTEEAAKTSSRIMPVETVFLVVRGMILAHTFPVCINSRPFSFNQDIKAVRGRDGLSTRFLGHWFAANGSEFLGKATASTHGTKKLDSDELHRTLIGIPSASEQKMIVNRIEETDAVVAGERSTLRQLHSLKIALMDDLLTGRVRVTPLLDTAERMPA